MRKWSKKLLKKEKGFTLIELIVVIAIIAILAAVLIPRFGNFSEDARRAAVEQEAKVLVQMVNLHFAETGAYPTTGNSGSAQLLLTDSDNTLTYHGVAGDCVVNNVTTVAGTGVDIGTNGDFSYTVRETTNSTLYTVTVGTNGEVTINP